MQLFCRLFFICLILLLAACQQESGGTPTVSTAEPTPIPQSTVITTEPEVDVPTTEAADTAELTPQSAQSTNQPNPPVPPPTAPLLTSVWETRAPLLEANSEMAVAELDGKIYVLGGYPSNRVTVTTVQIYDPETDSWTLGPPLPGPVNHTTAASVNGKLYLLGGQSSAAGGGPFLDAVYGLDPQAGEWLLKAPMPTARGGGAAAVVDDKIYVVGGRPPHGQDFAVYDPAADTWTVLPNMPTGRNHIAAGALNGKIYVVGGRFGSGFSSDMTNALEVFDPQTNSWSTAAPMPTVRGGINAAVINGCMHVFGGEGANGMFNQHEVYDPATNSWYTLQPMPTPVHGVTGSAVIDQWIHLPGGGTAVGGSSGSTIHQVVQTNIVCN